MKFKRWIVRAYKHGVRCAEVEIAETTRQRAKNAFIDQYPKFMLDYDITATLAK